MSEIGNAFLIKKKRVKFVMVFLCFCGMPYLPYFDLWAASEVRHGRHALLRPCLTCLTGGEVRHGHGTPGCACPTFEVWFSKVFEIPSKASKACLTCLTGFSCLTCSWSVRQVRHALLHALLLPYFCLKKVRHAKVRHESKACK